MPAQPPKHPYTDDHYNLACQVGQSCGQVDLEIAGYRRAGFDKLGMPLDAMQAENDTHKQAVADFKREYFPGRP